MTFVAEELPTFSIKTLNLRNLLCSISTRSGRGPLPLFRDSLVGHGHRLRNPAILLRSLTSVESLISLLPPDKRASAKCFSWE